MPKVRKLKDERWQVIREDGARLSLTYEQWREVMDWIEGVEKYTPTVKRLLEARDG